MNNSSNRITLLLGLLLLCLLAAPLLAATGPAGRVVAAGGKVVAQATDGSERRLRRRAEVLSGDTIQVSSNGFAQIRFSDGSLVALRADSTLKVDNYHYSGSEDGSEKMALGLLKGGLRTITGAIGRTNRENYSVKTPVATVGIRGTHYGLRLCADGSCSVDSSGDLSLYGGVIAGAVKVSNQGGDAIFDKDRYFYVADANTAAEELLEPPGMIFEGYHPTTTREKGRDGEGREGDDDDRRERDGRDDDDDDRDDDDHRDDGDREEHGDDDDHDRRDDYGRREDGGDYGDRREDGHDDDFRGPDDDHYDDDHYDSGGYGGGYDDDDHYEHDDDDMEPIFQGGEHVDSDDLLQGGDYDDDDDHGSGDQGSSNYTNPPDGSLVAFAAKVADQESNTWFAETVTHGAPNSSVQILGASGGSTAIADQPNAARAASGWSVTTLLFPSTVCGGTQCLLESGAAELKDVDLFSGLHLGRWVQDWRVTPVDPYGDWHFAIADPLYLTSSEALNAQQGTAVTFAALPQVSTRPTDEWGESGSLIPDATSMTVDFGSRQITQFGIGASIEGRGITLLGNLDSAVALASAAQGFDLSVTCQGCENSVGAGRANTNFLGDYANHAFGSFEMHAFGGHESALGTYVMENQGEVIEYPGASAGAKANFAGLFTQPNQDPGGFAAVAEQGPDSILLSSPDTGSSIVKPLYASHHNATSACTSGCEVDARGATSVESSMINDPGQQVSWGAWEQPWSVTDSSGTADSRGLLHYTYTDQATSQPDLSALSFYAYYDPLHGTIPTDEQGRVGSYIDGHPYASVDFGNRTLNEYGVAVRFEESNKSIYGFTANPVPLDSLHAPFPLEQVMCEPCGPDHPMSGVGEASITFVGSQAERAATSWNMTLSDGTGAAGAAVMVRGSTFDNQPF